MKNKQINKFLFMFVVGVSLLFNFSNASTDIFLEGDTYLSSKYWCGAKGSSVTFSSSFLTNEDSMVNTIIDYFNVLRNEPSYTNSDFEDVIDVFLDYYNTAYNSSFDSYVFCGKGGGPRIFLFNSNEVDLIGNSGSLKGNPVLVYSLLANSNFGVVYISPTNSAGSKISGTFYTGTVENVFDDAENSSSATFYNNPFSSNLSIKSLTNYSYNYSSKKYAIGWDGTYYQYIENTPEVEIPVFETVLTDDEIASVVENFINSMNWKNRESLYDYFFISYDENEGKYLLVLTSEYMYKLLSGLYIPAGVSSVDYEAMEYDTYSILYNNGVSGTFLPWQTNRFNYKLYTSLDGVNFDHLTDMDCKDFNKYRWTMKAPIIYSNFYLPFKTLLGNTVNDFDVTVNDYSEEIDLNFSELINSETGENHVFEGLDVKSNEETNPIIAKLSQFFKDMLEGFSGLFQVLIDQIFNFSDFLLATYGENVVTLVFAILIKSVTVLVSSIALIFRAVGFVLSLVAIPASSALFSVDVAVNSTGISFTGLNWGAKFVEGLNMLKTFSWNGLGLWTLFESFVSALEVILFVKIVKKHYSHTL